MRLRKLLEICEVKWGREGKSSSILKNLSGKPVNLLKINLPPMFLYSLDVVRATDLEIANTVEIAIVQILDEKCKF